MVKTLKWASLLILAGATAGCEQEHWFAYDTDAIELEVQGEAFVDAHLSTTPEAWPRRLYGDALRVRMDNTLVSFVGEVRRGQVLDEPREIDDHWGDNVNVLDAWEDCERERVCERTFRFSVVCTDADTCDGEFSGDSFLSTQGLVPERDRGGILDLELRVAASRR